MYPLDVSFVEIFGQWYGVVCVGSGASWEGAVVQADISLWVCPERGHLVRATKESSDCCHFCWSWRFLGEAKL